MKKDILLHSLSSSGCELNSIENTINVKINWNGKKIKISFHESLIKFASKLIYNLIMCVYCLLSILVEIMKTNWVHRTRVVDRVDHAGKVVPQRKFGCARMCATRRICGPTVRSCIKHGRSGYVIRPRRRDGNERKIAWRRVRAVGKFTTRCDLMNCIAVV